MSVNHRTQQILPQLILIMNAIFPIACLVILQQDYAINVNLVFHLIKNKFNVYKFPLVQLENINLTQHLIVWIVTKLANHVSITLLTIVMIALMVIHLLKTYFLLITSVIHAQFKIVKRNK